MILSECEEDLSHDFINTFPFWKLFYSNNAPLECLFVPIIYQVVKMK